MGVKGLKTFVTNQDELFVRNYSLHDTTLIIDAPNLMGYLGPKSQGWKRADLFGGDLVQFKLHLEKFLRLLSRCNITPIMVFDGTQVADENKSKQNNKLTQTKERFRHVRSVFDRGTCNALVMPSTMSNTYRSIIASKQIRIVQCMYEADADIARLSTEFRCPVLSDDSDFYILDVPYGVISIDSLDDKLSNIVEIINNKKTSYNYIECDLFHRDNFLKLYPRLNLETLPLLSVLAGNDYVSREKFSKFCLQLPNVETHNVKSLKFVKILNFLEGKTPGEIINLICKATSDENRPKLKKFLRGSVTAYDIPADDVFKIELKRIYRRGFYITNKKRVKDDQELEVQFEDSINSIADWLRNALETTGLTQKCLDLILRNPIFCRPTIDDFSLPTANECQRRCFEVMLSLLRESRQDKRPCLIYDRVGDDYSSNLYLPLTRLDNFGPLNCHIFDLPHMSAETREQILLATFNSTRSEYNENLLVYAKWFEAETSQEFLIIKILFKYINLISNKSQLSRRFRQSVLICIIGHWLLARSDSKLESKLEHFNNEIVKTLIGLTQQKRYSHPPIVNMRRKYNIRLVHQITQLHHSIVSFNSLNALLGSVLPRIRTELWLNSCFIYNLTELVSQVSPPLPNFVYQPLVS